MIETVIKRGIENDFGLHVQLNVPEFFQRSDFLQYIENQTVFTWHQAGKPACEWSDVAVLVEPNLAGEGDSSDMPEDLWDTILAALKARFGEKAQAVPPFARNRHIVVRLTNMEADDQQEDDFGPEVFTIEHNGDHYQSVFPSALADRSVPHATYLDAAKHLVMVRDLVKHTVYDGIQSQANLTCGFEDPKAIARALWQDFGTVPIHHDGCLDDECLVKDWLLFSAGTHREEVWHWFEEYFDLSVACDLMGTDHA